MAIANPEQEIDYCAETSGAKLEYQNPDRDVLEEEYEWGGVELTALQVPFQYQLKDKLGQLLETQTITPGSSVTPLATFEKNRYYSFVVTGTVTTAPSFFYDALFVVNIAESTTEPNDRLTTNDEQFENMFFRAAGGKEQELEQVGKTGGDEGTGTKKNKTSTEGSSSSKTGGSSEGDPIVEYDGVTHKYSVGYIGNGDRLTFSLAGTGDGALQIDIYENEYRLLLTDPDGENTYFDETRDRPFLNINIACGGDCPSRTTFPCECNGDRSCYYDNGDGLIEKIFEGSK